MRLLLTSSGISNKSIKNELRNLIGKDFKDLKLLFCTTASNYDGGDMKEWVIKDLEIFKNLDFQIDICDINGIPKEKLLERLEWADVYFFEGGSTQWLQKSIQNIGLKQYIPQLLETRVWIGASAGSCVLCPTVCNSCQDLFDENIAGFPTDGLGLVDFQFIPHLNNEWFPKIKIENLENASKNLKEIDGKKLYIVDDEGAVAVNGNTVKVISEGKWLEI